MEKERNPFKRWLQHSESGQAVILLAFGFVALTAFVGITTDISLMFVRYAQLSRSIDSAAIAAANQMRQDRSMATVGLAARQFIEFHGLDPETVIVDTCLTAPGDDEVCTDDQAKLVRVRAHIKSPTVFMRLLGFQDFDLWASSVSQTAALDVVMILDVSESMLRYTTVEDWANIQKIGDTSWDDYVSTSRQGVIYRPPTVNEMLANMGFSNDDVGRYASAFWADDYTFLGEHVIENVSIPGTPLLRPDL
ncbi:MAG: pilus assembly protein TadG-related protein, partial [Aggregatilineales bacterium]